MKAIWDIGCSLLGHRLKAIWDIGCSLLGHIDLKDIWDKDCIYCLGHRVQATLVTKITGYLEQRLQASFGTTKVRGYYLEQRLQAV